MRKKITLSVQDYELKEIDKRAKSLGLTRSGYVKSLTFRDINGAYDTLKTYKRRITDFTED